MHELDIFLSIVNKVRAKYSIAPVKQSSAVQFALIFCLNDCSFSETQFLVSYVLKWFLWLHVFKDQCGSVLSISVAALGLGTQCTKVSYQLKGQDLENTNFCSKINQRNSNVWIQVGRRQLKYTGGQTLKKKSLNKQYEMFNTFMTFVS